MIVGQGTKTVHHSVRSGFGSLLRSALSGDAAYCALGPIYAEDPAASTLAPFYRSAREAGLDPDCLSEQSLAPPAVIARSLQLRRSAVDSWDQENCLPMDWKDVEDWTRAGLVLEIAGRVGIPFVGGDRAHVRWKLRGTVTGRFGVESGGFNPMVIPRDQRGQIAPGYDRLVAVIDFKAMDLSSMLRVCPGLKEKYVGADDLHLRSAEILGLERDVAKRELFVYAYGGRSPHHELFEQRLPELKWIRGENSTVAGANARLVQKTSATAFKAGLSMALPLLCGDELRPMFTVHDELTLDVLNKASPDVWTVVRAVEKGASERMGVPYSAGMTVGRNYAEAKRG
jgi:hypothetical protein